MIPIAHRHDNYAPSVDPVALEAFLARRRCRREQAVRNIRMLSAMTPRELERRKRHASFLPPGSNVHRSRNLYLPDSSSDPFAAQVVFLAHYDTTINALGAGGSTIIGALAGVPPMTIGAPPEFGAAALQIPTGIDRCAYAGAGVIFGNGAVTHELWFDRSTASGPRIIMSTNLIGGSFIASLQCAAGNLFTYNLRATTVNTGVVFPPSVYTSIAVSIAAGTGLLSSLAFVNGVLVSSTTPGAGNGSSPASWGIGDINNGASGIAGSIDEYRITLAQRYTATYVPSGPFPNP